MPVTFTSMNKLPPEVLLEIFANLELEDLFSATGVCVNWHHIVGHMLGTKRRIHVMRECAPVIGDNSDLTTTENIAVINKANLVECLEKCLITLKQLFIVYDDSYFMHDHAFDLCSRLQDIFKSAVNLISLNLIGSVRCTRSLITTIIQHCPDTIETVSLSLRKNGYDNNFCSSEDESEMDESFRLIKSQMYGENLREMKITIVGPTTTTTSKMYGFYNNAMLPTVDIDLTIPNNLCEIHLLNCCGLDTRAYHVIGLASNLKTVTLKYAYNLDTNGVNAISKLPHLQTLSISDAVRVTEDGWKWVFTQCTSLIALNLKRCVQISDSVFSYGVDAVCANLEMLKLDFENCKRVTSVGLQSLLTACVRLVSLRLCVDYDEDTVDTIRRCLTNHLRRLTSSVVTIQVALAVPSKQLFDSLPPHCSFVVKTTKLVFT